MTEEDIRQWLMDHFDLKADEVATGPELPEDVGDLFHYEGDSWHVFQDGAWIFAGYDHDIRNEIRMTRDNT